MTEAESTEAVDGELLDILRHALGSDVYGCRGRNSRNHYVASGRDAVQCRALVALGLMNEHSAGPLTGGAPLFTVTPNGERMVREHSLTAPSLTRGQRRYRAFLAEDSGLSFGDWLKKKRCSERHL